MKRKIMALFLCTYLIFTMFNTAKAASYDYAGYKLIAQNTNLSLYYNETRPSVIIRDNRNGFEWSSSVSEEYYQRENMSESLKNQIQSLFTLIYTDFNKTNEQISPATKEVEQNIKSIDNGISIDFYFPDTQIGFTLNIWLDKNSVNFKVPVDSIKEESKYAIVSMEMLPYLGASKGDEDGYIFYPDGSGALLRFKNIPVQSPRRYIFDIFGPETVRMGSHTSNNFSSRQVMQAMLPVFGLKRGDNAYAAIVTAGEYDTSINLSPSGYIVELGRISAEFKYRRRFSYLTADNKEITTVERDMIKTDHEIRYEFLSGSSANYSGMANAYRQYLLDTGGIKISSLTNESIPLALNLFMGIKEERLLFDKYIKMTTFPQAKTILEEFVQNGIDNIHLNLVGWTKDGYGTWPIHTPPARALGGAGGLKELADYAEEKAIPLYLQSNFTDAYSENGGFSKRKDIVYQRTGLALTDLLKNHFLFNPFRAYNRFIENFVDQAVSYNVSGLNFERFGRILYPDFGSEYPSTRQQTAEQWLKIMDETKSRLGYTAVKGGNAFVLKSVDRLFDIPIEDSGYFITDECVPFYQMVVHGLIPYSATPGNLFHDFEKQKLKWIEYGCIPYFELTYEKSSALKYTEYNHLFTSHYKDWVLTASDVYKEFNERLGHLYSQAMIEHKKIQDDVYKIVYQDQSVVYINYKDQPVKVEGHTVPAVDYLVIDGRGNKT